MADLGGQRLVKTLVTSFLPLLVRAQLERLPHESKQHSMRTRPSQATALEDCGAGCECLRGPFSVPMSGPEIRRALAEDMPRLSASLASGANGYQCIYWFHSTIRNIMEHPSLRSRIRDHELGTSRCVRQSYRFKSTQNTHPTLLFGEISF